MLQYVNLVATCKLSLLPCKLSQNPTKSETLTSLEILKIHPTSPHPPNVPANKGVDLLLFYSYKTASTAAYHLDTRSRRYEIQFHTNVEIFGV